MRGYSPEEKGGGAVAAVRKSFGGLNGRGVWERPRRGSRRFFFPP
jgi:hypothetical protein